jgi:phosphoribosylglycinamide formyltransferase-1
LVYLPKKATFVGAKTKIMTTKPVPKIKIAMLASGQGTNVANFIEHFKLHEVLEVALIVSNIPDAPVLKRASNSKIPHMVIRKDEWKNKELVLGIFKQNEIDFIVLAGFLLLLPEYLIEEFPKRIVNIHPALLPKFGGRGMYGMNVHRQVIANNEKQSGITIHQVNEKYDDGKMLFQQKIKLSPGETPESLATKIQLLEYEHYPRVVETLILKEVLNLPKKSKESSFSKLNPFKFSS